MKRTIASGLIVLTVTAGAAQAAEQDPQILNMCAFIFLGIAHNMSEGPPAKALRGKGYYLMQKAEPLSGQKFSIEEIKERQDLVAKHLRDGSGGYNQERINNMVIGCNTLATSEGYQP